MAARMRTAVRRRPWLTRALNHGKAIHIRAEQQAVVRRVRANEGNNATRILNLMSYPKLRKSVGDKRSGTSRMQTNFRNSMQFVPPSDKLP